MRKQESRIYGVCDAIYRCREAEGGYVISGRIIGVISLVLITYMGVSWGDILCH